jgi:hypothetical protein
MSAIIAISFKKDDLAKLQANPKGYVNLTAMVDDKNGKFGHNVSIIIEQTKEERDAKAKRVYVGSGKVVYVGRDGIKTAKELESENAPNPGDPW